MATSSGDPITELVHGYCAMCVSNCGSTAVVQDGRFIELRANPSHPTGKALCAKGKAAPELVYHQGRLLHPMKRTRPKGDADPGWERISWDEALDAVASKLREIAEQDGPESVAFGVSSPSTTASDDFIHWMFRLKNAFGSPNACISMELCGWGRYLATSYTFGAAVPGAYMPDLENAGCILYWGYNPNLSRLSHAIATVDALKRGAKLVVVDPRKVGPVNKADHWLRVRPGTDAALALGLANVMIENGWYDQEFVRDWTNGPLLVREDTGRLLTPAELSPDGSAEHYVAWSEALGGPVTYDPATVAYDPAESTVALSGTRTITTLEGEVVCRTAFDLVAEECGAYTPERVEEICGIDRGLVVEAARMLWEHRPLAYYAWSGVEMQTNSTQIARAIGQLCVLTGSFDVPGGNVLFPSIPENNVSGRELLPQGQSKKTLGFAERPLGVARFGFVTSDEVYRGILDQQPYPVRGLVNFGSNLLLAHADSRRGRDALAALDFFVHVDLFMNPTAELADIVLPAATAFEREALNIGFAISPDAQSFVQLRQKVIEPQGASRSDVEIIFDLACRLGLGDHFWDGDIEAGNRHRLTPSGISLEELREHPEGIRVPYESRYRKFAELHDGVPRGFATPSKKIEIYSQTLAEGGYPAVPTYEEPLVGPVSQPRLARKYPLVLTCSKDQLFCETQHRQLPSLREHAMDPEVEMHPSDAADRGIQVGDWVNISTPEGSVRARARFNNSLSQGVACGQHGWWQASPEIGAPGYDPFSEEGANYNMIIGNDAIDPISGSVPHRAYLCEIRLAT